MKRIFNQILDHRAQELAGRLEPWIPPASRLLDIGSGTGHNAVALEAQCQCTVQQLDVVDMSAVGPRPQLFNGRDLPFSDDAYEIGLLLFVLHYAAAPEALLGEARRVVKKQLLVIQSTYQSRLGLLTLRGRELMQGRFAFRAARRAGLIKPCACPLQPERFMNRPVLEALFRQAGWAIRQRHPAPWPGLGLSRDLYILERK